MLVTVCFVALLSLAAGQKAYKDPHFAPNRDGIVQLFEWNWKAIATECETYLGPRSFGGVQVSPIQENIVVQNRPWWERYQPMSYNFTTRSGNKTEFADMVKRCNKAGVRIYVEAILNHMTASHGTATGTGNSTAETTERQYYAVPYTQEDFHDVCQVCNYNNMYNVRNCELNGLHDLDQSRENVREKLVNFMNEAIGLGVAGFYINAAKHMWPRDLAITYSRLYNLNTSHGFQPGLRPFIYQDVTDPGCEAVSKYEYISMGSVTESKYGEEISNSILGNKPLKWLKNWGEASKFLPRKDSLVYIDDHETQRYKGIEILNFKNSRPYQMAVAFMLAHPYGIPRVMSSYNFTYQDEGPPANTNGIIGPGSRSACENR